MSTGIMAPERSNPRRLEVGRELDLRPLPWTRIGVLVIEYASRRVVNVCSRQSLLLRLTNAIDASTVEEERQNFAAIRETILHHMEAVPVLVVARDEVALELATPEYFTPVEYSA